MNITRRMILSMSIVFLGPTLTLQADDVPSLIKQFNSWSTDKAKKASDELAAMGKPVVPEVAKALSSKSRRRGRFAARTLRQIGQDAADAIPALSESLKDSDALTREYSVEALAKMLRQADRLIPLLQEMTDDEDEDVRAQAKLAVVRLTEALKSRDQAESAQQPATEAPTTLAAAQNSAVANPVQHEPSQPSGADAGDSSVTQGIISPTEKSYSVKLSPMLLIRCALFMFVPVGFFSLLYFYREHP